MQDYEAGAKERKAGLSGRAWPISGRLAQRWRVYISRACPRPRSPGSPPLPTLTSRVREASSDRSSPTTSVAEKSKTFPTLGAPFLSILYSVRGTFHSLGDTRARLRSERRESATDSVTCSHHPLHSHLLLRRLHRRIASIHLHFNIEGIAGSAFTRLACADLIVAVAARPPSTSTTLQRVRETFACSSPTSGTTQPYTTSSYDISLSARAQPLVVTRHSLVHLSSPPI